LDLSTRLPTKSTGKSYIGCKHLYRYKKNKRTTESTWKYYCSSSKYLEPDIQKLGKRAFSFVILLLCKNKRDLYYNEMKYRLIWMFLGVMTTTIRTLVVRGSSGPLRVTRLQQDGIKNAKYLGPFTITYDNGVEHRIENMSVREFAERHGMTMPDLSSQSQKRKSPLS
jgi:hypothetical protein